MSAIPVFIAETLRELRSRLVADFGAKLLDLRLFGSYARGEADADSDVDLLVLLAETSWQDRCRVIDLCAELGLERGLILSPTVFDRATFELWRAQERPLVMDIEREGITP